MKRARSWASSDPIGAVLLTICVIALVMTAAALVHPPAPTVSAGFRGQLGWVVRLVGALAVPVAVLFGPGWAIRRRLGWFSGLGCAFLPLPGLGVGVAGALGVWVTADRFAPTTSAGLLVILVVSICGVALLLPGRRPEPGHDAVAPMAGLAGALFVAVAAARSTWSMDPAGSLYAGTISRTLEIGDRSDSRIPYHVVQLVSQGTDPYSPEGAANFLPWSFADRGPIGGLFSALSVLASGSRPSLALPDAAWSPFDATGFASYRMAMIVLASALFVAVYPVVADVAGRRVAELSVLLLAGTPFVLHEAWFTWPKLLSTAVVVMAAAALGTGRWATAGLLVGVAYLCHPLALLAVPALVAWALIRRAELRHPVAVLVPGVRAAVGLALPVLFWRWTDRSDGSPSGFLDFPRLADGVIPQDAGQWLVSRVESATNTLVPLAIPFVSPDNRSVNALDGSSTWWTHVGFGWWTSVPQGLALVSFPVLVWAVVRIARSRPWCFTGLVLVPFVVFLVYWGFSVSGLLREGMHPWAVTLVVIMAFAVGRLRRVPWLLALALAARPVEGLVMMLWPVWGTPSRLLAGGDLHRMDALALLVMFVGSLALATLTWRAARKASSVRSGPSRLPVT